VFNWPESGEDASPAPAAEQRGYHVLTWRAGGFGYRAVSDLNARELTEFAKLLAAAAAKP
jgi:anti-sigma factor RsiW